MRTKRPKDDQGNSKEFKIQKTNAKNRIEIGPRGKGRRLGRRQELKYVPMYLTFEKKHEIEQ